MGLFDDLKKSTKTPEEVRQYEKDLQVRKRLNALNGRLEHIKKSIIEETKSAAKNGKRSITLYPYFQYEDYDRGTCIGRFHITSDFWKVKGHMFKYSKFLRSDWKDFYDLRPDGIGNEFGYGFIIAEDRPYIIEKTEEFLRAEGFKYFSVEYANEYRYPEKKVFKEPTGRKVLQVQIMW